MINRVINVRVPDDVSLPPSESFPLAENDLFAPAMHVPVFLCFEHDTGEAGLAKEAFIDAVACGIQRTVADMPVIAGAIDVQNPAQPKIRVSPTSTILLGVADQSDEKSLSSLEASDYSPRLFDHVAMLNPENLSVSELSGFRKEVGTPVMYAQLNFISGGVVFGICLHHWVTDAGSINTVLVALSDHIRSALTGSPTKRHQINLDRRLFQGTRLEAEEIRQVQQRMKCYNIMDAAAPGSGYLYESIPASLTGVLYRFEHTSLDSLRGLCSTSLSDGELISTYDCVYALLWRAITRARSKEARYSHVSVSAAFSPMDIRTRKKNVPENYIGNAVSVGVAGWLPLEKLLDPAELPRVAAEVRKSTMEAGLQNLQDVLNIQVSLPSDKRVDHALKPTTGLDVLASSWMQMEIDKYDLGIGACRAVRTPLVQLNACSVFYPTSTRGTNRALIVAVYLEEHLQAQLGKDPELLRYGRQLA